MGAVAAAAGVGLPLAAASLRAVRPERTLSLADGDEEAEWVLRQAWGQWWEEAAQVSSVHALCAQPQ